MTNSMISKFFTVPATTTGVEVPLLGRGSPKINSGYIEQVIATAVSGGGAHVDIEIRYKSGNDDEEQLVYQLIDEPFPVVDSRVRGPFSLLDKTDTGEDMYLFVRPEVDGVINIRIDIEMLKFN